MLPLSWFIFSGLVIAGFAAYNIAVRVGGENINPFVFTSILTVVALVLHVSALGFYKYVLSQNINLQINNTGIWAAVVAGISVFVIDLTYFYAIKIGGLSNTQAFSSIGGLICLTLVAAYIFHEGMNIKKICGVVLGMVAMYLIVKG